MNLTGAGYKNAKLKLIAGDVQRIQPQRDVYPAVPRAAGKMMMAEAAGFEEKAFFEYPPVHVASSDGRPGQHDAADHAVPHGARRERREADGLLRPAAGGELAVRGRAAAGPQLRQPVESQG